MTRMKPDGSCRMPLWEGDETSIGEIRFGSGWMSPSMAQWASVYYAPRCGGYFCAYNHHDDVLPQLSSHSKAVLSWHIFRNNLERGLLPLARPSYQEVEYKMADRMNFAWITHEPRVSQEGQFSRVKDGLSSWAEARANKSPSAQQGLVSLVGEIIRQTDLDYSLSYDDARAFLYAAGACINRNQLSDMLRLAQERHWLRDGDIEKGPWKVSWQARIWYQEQRSA